jgi:hypothetical protein
MVVGVAIAEAVLGVDVLVVVVVVGALSDDSVWFCTKTT